MCSMKLLTVIKQTSGPLFRNAYLLTTTKKYYDDYCSV